MSAVTIPARMDASHPVCSAYRDVRSVPRDRVVIHASARAALLAFAAIRRNAGPAAGALPPVIALRNGRAFRVVAGFRSWIAARGAAEVSVAVIAPVDDAAVARLAWGEVLDLLPVQIAPRGGHRAAARALRSMPLILREEAGICSLSDRALAGLLGVDATRVREERT